MKLAEMGERDAMVVLGSGLSGVAAALAASDPISYAEIEGMPPARVVGHEGALHDVKIGEKRALIFAGRAHLYEGHDAAAVCFAVREVVAAGTRTVILTNAAGGIATSLEVGDLCLISDQLNLTGLNPLTGEARFLDLTDLYDPHLRELAHAVDGDLEEGVYAGLPGPTYETPAEIRMLAGFGADLVGMSTVLEAIAGRAGGARVLGVSIVSNKAAGLSDRRLDHREVAAAGRATASRLRSLLEGVIDLL